MLCWLALGDHEALDISTFDIYLCMTYLCMTRLCMSYLYISVYSGGWECECVGVCVGEAAALV